LAARRRRRRRQALIALALLAGVAAVTVDLVGASHGRAGAGTAAATRQQLRPVSGLGPLTSPGQPGAIGPEGVPIPAGPVLAPPRATGRTADGIACQAGEKVAFHIHAHLTIFVNGSVRQVPAAVGIAQPQAEETPQGPFIGSGSCFYWLHTHAADGIIHVESPAMATYRLGQFFDIWGEPLGPNDVGPATGRVTAFYNGQHWIGKVRDIPLDAHAQIQLDVATPLVAPDTIQFPSGL
jgi:hypothetical protein